MYQHHYVRLDVMNKTLLRAVKREYSEFHTAFWQRNGIKTPVPHNDFIDSVDKFIVYILGWEDPVNIKENYDNLGNLTQVLGVFIDFCKMKKIAKNNSEKDFLKNFYNLLYSYSHKKFNEFLETPEIRFLLKKMLNEDYIDTLISKNETLQVKGNGYKECAAIIVSNIAHIEKEQHS